MLWLNSLYSYTVSCFRKRNTHWDVADMHEPGPAYTVYLYGHIFVTFIFIYNKKTIFISYESYNKSVFENVLPCILH